MENIKKYSTTNEWLISQILLGTTYAGTGTKEELAELEKNMRELLQLKLYPYNYIEKYLLDKGYRLDLIRKVFFDITGVKAESLFNEKINKDYYNTPATIPQFNLGWGEAKDKKYDYYFIMPYLYGYAIYGQKGEHEREMVKAYEANDLESAKLDLSKMIKNGKDSIYTLKPTKIEDMWYNGIMEPKYSSQAIQIKDYLNFCKTDIDKEKYIKEAYYSGIISKEDFINLMKFVKKAAEESQTESKKENILEDYNVNKELAEISPSDFFDNSANYKNLKLAEIVNGIQDYLIEKQKEIGDKFSISIHSFKYKTSESINYVEKAVEKEEKEGFEILKSSGIVSVVLQFEKGKENLVKYGLMVFSIVDEEMQTTGDFKGEDNKIYSLSSEGLELYFKTK
jgi:hypothetical protein